MVTSWEGMSPVCGALPWAQKCGHRCTAVMLLRSLQPGDCWHPPSIAWLLRLLSIMLTALPAAPGPCAAPLRDVLSRRDPSRPADDAAFISIDGCACWLARRAA